MLPFLLNPDSGGATVDGYDIVKEKDGVRRSLLEEERMGSNSYPGR
jgi:ABC-type Na+ transport system ATPase subunit NatA